MTGFPKFSEKKATDSAALLLELHGGRMKYIRLLKLLYLSDRLAFEKLGRSITNDVYCSMQYGQVPSRAYDLVKRTAASAEGTWRRHINSPVDKFYVQLTDQRADLKSLSQSEVDILTSVSMKYIDKTEWEIADITKGPEYIPTKKGQRNDTPVERILSKMGFSDKQVENIKAGLFEEAQIKAFFGK